MSDNRPRKTVYPDAILPGEKSPLSNLKARHAVPVAATAATFWAGRRVIGQVFRLAVRISRMFARRAAESPRVSSSPKIHKPTQIQPVETMRETKKGRRVIYHYEVRWKVTVERDE
jgi:hypothetical protein